MSRSSFFRYLFLVFCSIFIFLPIAQSQEPPSNSQMGLYATPKIRYVGPSTLNVRNQPKSGVIIEKLKRGKKVEVYDEVNGWSLISSSQQKWVSSEHLCTTANCVDNTRWIYTAPTQQNKSKTTTRRASRSSYIGGCPCSSSSNCYGPRGGRYCITSGGNKRYR